MPKKVSPISVEKIHTNEELEQLLEEALRERDVNKKGEKFEIFFENLMAREEKFRFVDRHSRSEVGEVDYIYGHRLEDHPLWKLSSYICVECKNWKEKISSEKMDHFINLVTEKSPFSCCGVYITTSSYSRQARISMRDAKMKSKIIIVPIERKHLKDLIKKGFKALVQELSEKVVLKN